MMGLCLSSDHIAHRKSPGKSRIARLDMAEFAGSNPTEPIVLFTIGCDN
jgi:hypothetical protein